MLELIYRCCLDDLHKAYRILLTAAVFRLRGSVSPTGDWEILRKAHSIPLAAASLCKTLKVAPGVHILLPLKRLEQSTSYSARRTSYPETIFFFFFALCSDAMGLSCIGAMEKICGEHDLLCSRG